MLNKEDFNLLIRSAHMNKASDIHLREGERPSFRISGDLKQVKTNAYTKEDIEAVIKIISGKDQANAIKELDGSFRIPNVCRLRYNVLLQQGRLAIIFRLIPLDVPTIKGLGLPKGIDKIIKAKSGLVLVTGATGSGKSTTLAAMINSINEERPVHILTLEDPIEFVYQQSKARITQREIGVDTEDFESALRAALRQDPDIMMIGEMRDAMTVGIALKASETGHLVFGTIHTTNALNTVGRLISMFPPGEQDAARLRIADNLYATVSQRLVKKKDGKGVVAAQEIMITSPGIKESIQRPEKIDEIYTYIEKGKTTSGTQSFDQHLVELYEKQVISLEDAKASSSSPEDFERNLIFKEE